MRIMREWAVSALSPVSVVVIQIDFLCALGDAIIMQFTCWTLASL